MARRKERFTDLEVWQRRAEELGLLTEVGPLDTWINAVNPKGDIVGQWLPDEVCHGDGVSKTVTNGWLWVKTAVDSR